jgi:uncharacterized protein (TIGR03435 family)
MRTLLALAVLPILSGGALAQNAARAQFDVASIKPAAPDQPGTYIRNTPDGRLDIGNLPLKEMIVLAWLDSVRFDVSAKSEGTVKPDEKLQMLQGLLADRFQLMLHRETKEFPIYALVVARKDGKLGPRLTELKEGSCAQPDRACGENDIAAIGPAPTYGGRQDGIDRKF